MNNKSKKLPQEFIDFAKENSHKYSMWELRVILSQKYGIRISETYVRKLLEIEGFKSKYKPKKILPYLYFKKL